MIGRRRDVAVAELSEEAHLAQWAAEHAEEVEVERKARVQLRAAVLDILGVTEEQLEGNVFATKCVLSSAALDAEGEPFPDIRIAARKDQTTLFIYDRFTTDSPAGWVLKPTNARYSTSPMNECLGSQLETRRYMPIHQDPEISADNAAGRLSDVLEYVSLHPQVYDFDASPTLLKPFVPRA